MSGRVRLPVNRFTDANLRDALLKLENATNENASRLSGILVQSPRQASPPTIPIDMVSGALDLYILAPANVSTSAASVGVATTASPGDHVHRLLMGAGSGLDADTLDGLDSLAFIKANGTVPLTSAWDAGNFLITAGSLSLNSATIPLIIGTATALTGTTTVQITSGSAKTGSFSIHQTKLYFGGTGGSMAHEFILVSDKTSATTGTGTLSLKVSVTGTTTITNSGASAANLSLTATGQLILTGTGSGVSSASNFLTNDIRGRTAVPLVIGSTTNTAVTLAAAAIPTNILSNTISLGPDSGTTDVTLNFKSGTNDGSIVFDESVPGFLFAESVAIGATTPSASTKLSVRISDASLYASKIGGYFEVSNGVASGSTTGFQAYVTSNSNSGGSGGAAYYGASVLAEYKDATNVPSNEVIGGTFNATISDMAAGTGGNVIGGRFIASLQQGATKICSQIAGGIFIPQTAGAYAGGATDAYGWLIQPDFIAGGSITSLYGGRIQWDSSITPTNVYGIYLDSSPYAAAAKGNIYFAGGNWDTGHLQLENGHVWNDATNNAITFRGAAPSGETNGIGLSGLTITAGTGVGTVTNGPWTTTPKNPDKWLEIWQDGVKYAVPAWNLS